MYEKAHKYSYEQWKEITNADCIEVARSLGFQFDEKRSDKTALRIKDNGGLFVWRDGSGWYQHSTGEKGRAVDLVMKSNNCEYKEAMDYIFGNVLCKSSYELERHVHTEYSAANKQKVQTQKEEFVLPEKSKRANRVFAYLEKTRCIHPDIISSALHNKILYQSADYGNCCFVGYDKEGTARYCAKRGTTTGKQFRGEVSGSQKECAWKMMGSLTEGGKLYIYEAPIDAMSHATLHKITGHDWTKDTRLALGGGSMFALHQHLQDYPNRYSEIVVCVDNDEAGRKIERKILDELDGEYNITRRFPFSKDWNEDLVKITDLSEIRHIPIKDAIDAYYNHESRTSTHSDRQKGVIEAEDGEEPEPEL